MKLPQPIDYQQAVQRPDVTFIDEVLRAGKPRMTPLGAPWAATGGFALTFDITAPQERFAVRCFHRQGNHLQERYARIAQFVGENQDLDFLVDVAYLAEGIRIEGNPLPVVRMPWVRGTPLNAWVEDNLHDRAALRQVRGQLSRAVQRMRGRGAAHGDLQHGNVLVGQQNAIRLVDYDGMFLPSLSHYGAPENGHRNYQHPDRDNHYDESLDLFAGQVIELSLAALEHEPALWDEFNTDQNLLFSADDFADPGSSALFARLRSLPELQEPTRRLMSACEADFGAVPDVLLGGSGTAQAKRSPSAGRRGTSHPSRLFGRDRSAIVEAEGDEVTITGPIVASRTTWGRSRTPVTFLNFGNYRRADPVLVAFGSASRELRAHFGEDLAELQNRWVSMTGFVQLYQTRWAADPTPQLEVRRARSLHLLTAAEVEQVVAEHQGRASADADREDADPGDAGAEDEVGDDTGSAGHQQSPQEAPATHSWSGNLHSRPNPAPSRQAPAASLDERISSLYSAPRFSHEGSGTGSAGASRPEPKQQNPQGNSRPNSSRGSRSTSPKDSGSPPAARQSPAPNSGGAASPPPRSSPTSSAPPPSAPPQSRPNPSAAGSPSSGSAVPKPRRMRWPSRLRAWFRRK